VLLKLPGHEKDLGGGFRVSRLLPSFARRTVGPFVFMDHFGPITFEPGMKIDVRPHPHIGLATVTYLFDGAIMHRDSLGSVQRIAPGAINWMSAGGGIVHSERTPEDLRAARHGVHGLQLWVGLPQSLEESAPTFTHTPAEQLSAFPQQGAEVRVLVGEAFGRASPVKAASPTLFVALQLKAGASFRMQTAAASRPPKTARWWSSVVHPWMGRDSCSGISCRPRNRASNRRPRTGVRNAWAPCPVIRNSYPYRRTCRFLRSRSPGSARQCLRARPHRAP